MHGFVSEAGPKFQINTLTFLESRLNKALREDI